MRVGKLMHHCPSYLPYKNHLFHLIRWKNIMKIKDWDMAEIGELAHVSEPILPDAQVEIVLN